LKLTKLAGEIINRAISFCRRSSRRKKLPPKLRREFSQQRFYHRLVSLLLRANFYIISSLNKIASEFFVLFVAAASPVMYFLLGPLKLLEQRAYSNNNRLESAQLLVAIITPKTPLLHLH